jgi:hypothetical protein
MRKPSRAVCEAQQSLYLEEDAVKSITNLLDAVEYGFRFKETIRNRVDAQTLDLFDGVFNNAILPMVSDVRKLDLGNTAILNAKHPDFAEACARLRAMGSSDTAATAPIKRPAPSPFLLVPQSPVA